MPKKDFKANEYFNQFAAQFEADRTSKKTIAAFNLGVSASINMVHDLIKSGSSISDLKEVCQEYEDQLKGGSDEYK